MKPRTAEILGHGLVAGLIGYAIVALFYAVWNVLEGRSPFYTAALLGQALFYAPEDPAVVDVWAGPVLAFNGVQVLAFIAIGLFVAWLTTSSERGPQLWYVGISLLVYGMIHALALSVWLDEPLREALPAWSSILATLLALAGMTFYLLRVHPRLRRQMRQFRD